MSDRDEVQHWGDARRMDHEERVRRAASETLLNALHGIFVAIEAEPGMTATLIERGKMVVAELLCRLGGERNPQRRQKRHQFSLAAKRSNASTGARTKLYARPRPQRVAPRGTVQ